MAVERSIPKAASALTDRAGLPTREWYSFLQQLASQATNTNLRAELEALAARVKALEDAGQNIATILGLGSLLVSGSLADGQVVITLEGDTDAPGPTFFYGTGPDGLKGWKRLYDAIETPSDGITRTDSGYLVLGEVATAGALPGAGAAGQAWRVTENGGLYAWDGTAFVLDPAADGRVGIIATDDLAALEALSGEGIPWRDADSDWRLRKVGRVVVNFSFGDASPAPVYQAPHALLVVNLRIVVRVPFNGMAPQLSIGHGADPQSLFPASRVAPTVAGSYEYTPDVQLAAGTNFNLSITPDGSSAGSGQLVIDTIPLEEI